MLSPSSQIDKFKIKNKYELRFQEVVKWIRSNCRTNMIDAIAG